MLASAVERLTVAQVEGVIWPSSFMLVCTSSCSHVEEMGANSEQTLSAPLMLSHSIITLPWGGESGFLFCQITQCS